MGIVLYRLDDRLIHGQVVEGWFHHIRPDLVVVADDAAAGDEFHKSLMEIVVPFGVRSEILPIREAVDRVTNGAYGPNRGIMLFRFPRDVLRALGMGLTMERLNLGGLHSDGKTRVLGKGINASTQDLRDLQEIVHQGVKVEICPVPSEPVVDLRHLL
ncbi:MAG: PTS sugar transporter subunit IIB [bacterium]|nr:PTS sugar transporter subunit IIB [bacterium]